VLTTGITDPSIDLVEQLKLTMLRNLQYRLAKDEYSATTYDRFLSVAYVVFERMIEQWLQTQEYYHWTNPKRVYYLSMEFLLGRSLSNALLNLGLSESCAQALREMGVDLDELAAVELDAGLGNGGLGRLAACFLDSMATLGIPSHGYGLRYDYGLFRQQIVHGRQVEAPDKWLALPNPWEILRPEVLLKIHFGGRVEQQTTPGGGTHSVCGWRRVARHAI